MGQVLGAGQRQPLGRVSSSRPSFRRRSNALSSLVTSMGLGAVRAVLRVVVLRLAGLMRAS